HRGAAETVSALPNQIASAGVRGAPHKLSSANRLQYLRQIMTLRWYVMKDTVLSRVGEVGRGGLNRPKLSVPRFHFAPHRTGHTDFPCPALRVCLVASLQALLRGCVQPALTGSGHSP